VFNAYWNMVHHKFLVTDFNDEHPTVFTGSSNMAQGGKEENGDHLIQIEDRKVAISYAIEALRLFDHFHFRVNAQSANAPSELRLVKPPAPGKKPWFASYYRTGHVKERDRELSFAESIPPAPLTGPGLGAGTQVDITARYRILSSAEQDGGGVGPVQWARRVSQVGSRQEAGREYEFTATNPQKQVTMTTKLRTSAIANKKGRSGAVTNNRLEIARTPDAPGKYTASGHRFLLASCYYGSPERVLPPST
jgi:PLD-like domain